MKYSLKIAAQKTDLLSKIGDIGLSCESGKSKYAPADLRMMLNDIKKKAKEESVEVDGRIATARSDMND